VREFAPICSPPVIPPSAIEINDLPARIIPYRAWRGVIGFASMGYNARNDEIHENLEAGRESWGFRGIRRSRPPTTLARLPCVKS
jgi:hypothetical protein